MDVRTFILIKKTRFLNISKTAGSTENLQKCNFVAWTKLHLQDNLGFNPKGKTLLKEEENSEFKDRFI